MLVTLILALITCVCLILSVLLFPKIKIKNLEIHTYWIVCLIGACLVLIFNEVSFSEIIAAFTADTNINPIKILILFFSMTILSLYLDELGFFKYLASKAAYLAKTHQMVWFLLFYVLTSVLTIFTSNDIVILTLTPFICYFCKNSAIDPKPYLIGEFAAANTWSMMLLIGNPTNIYLCSAGNITFIDYLRTMVLPTIVAGVVEFLIIFLIFHKSLAKPMTYQKINEKIADPLGLALGLMLLSLCLVLLILSSFLNFAMWIIALGCALGLLLAVSIKNLISHQGWKELGDTIKRVPYELIPFVLSMFIIVASLNKQGIAAYLTAILDGSYAIFTYGSASFLTANLINNIPMSVLFSTLPHMENINNIKALYATIIGSNLGAFLTPLGALAGIMFTQLVNKYEVKYDFKTFIEYGAIIAIPTLLSALVTLEFVI